MMYMNTRLLFCSILSCCLLLISVITFADDACSTYINVPQACSDLDYSNSLSDNPYYYKNPNTLCGINISMNGLPTFGFDMGKLKIPDLSFCGLLKGVVKGHVLDILHHLLPHFAVHPPAINI